MIFVILFFICISSLHAKNLKNCFSIDFQAAMSHSNVFNREFAQQDENWRLLKRNYERGIQKVYEPHSNKIPKTFHLIWLGSRPPQRYINLRRQLKKLHPDYAVKLWTDKEAKSYNLINRFAFDAATNYGEKADIFRYEILYNEGGVYLDGDFKILKPFNDLLCACDLFAGCAYGRQVQILNGLIGATAQHPVLKICVDEVGASSQQKNVTDILTRTGPIFFTRCFFKYAHRDQIHNDIIFPVAFFYPWPHYHRLEKNKQIINKYIKSYSYAIHEWACSWMK